MNPLEVSKDEFRRLADEVITLSAEYFSNLDARSIFPNTTGTETEQVFSLPLPERGLGDRALDDLRKVMERARAQNGRFFGYVQRAGESVSAIGDLFASVINQNMT